MADEDDVFAGFLEGSTNDKQMKEIFKMFDQDGDDLIDMDELRNIFQQMGQDPS